MRPFFIIVFGLTVASLVWQMLNFIPNPKLRVAVIEQIRYAIAAIVLVAACYMLAKGHSIG